MNGKQKDVNEKLAEDVANRSDIDWSKVEEENAIGQKLKGIAQLANAFQKSGNLDNMPQEDPLAALSDSQEESCLFTWGHLKVLEKIGEGSFGEVYRAFDTVLEREVALKVRSDSAAHVKNWAFIHEARRIARIRHPNVLAIHGADIIDGRVAIWTDLIEGETLQKEMEEKLPCSPECILKFAIPLIKAIKAVHYKGLVHGDIKSSNIMVEADGRVILMDFGAGSQQNKKNGIGLTTGTPLYMAPELFHGKMGSTSSDIYSFGVLLFHMLVGRFPLEGKTLPELVYQHETATSPSLKKERKGLYKEWIKLVDSCLGPPEQRPTAEQALQQLLWIQSYPKRKTKRRMLVGIFSVLLMGIFFSTFGFITAKEETRKAEVAMNQSEDIKDFLVELLSASAPHIKGRDAKVIDLLDSADSRLEKELADQPKTQALILNTIGRTYMQLGAYEKAHALLKRSENLAADLPESKGTYLQSRFLQSECLNLQGNTEESVNMFQECLEQCLLFLGEGDSLTFQVATGLAIALGRQGNLESSEAMIHKAFGWENEAKEKIKYRARLQLGHIYSAQSKYQEAENVFKELLAWHHRSYEQDKAQSIVINASLAIALIQLGELKEALPIQEECLKASRIVYGEDHLTTLSNQLNYCTLLQELGEYRECLDCLDIFTHGVEKTFGPESPYILAGKINRAATLQALGSFEEATELNREILAAYLRTKGKKDPNTLLTVINLAETLNETGLPGEAENLILEYQPILFEVFGKNHHFLLEAEDLLGQSYYYKGRYNEARDIHQSVLALKVKLLGFDSIYCYNTRTRLAMAEWKQGHLENALVQANELLDLIEKKLGCEHPKFFKAKGLIQKISEQ